MENVDVYQKELWCLVVEFRFSIFIFYMGQRFIKVVYRKNLGNMKEI